MDRLFVCMALCACLCLTPTRTAREPEVITAYACPRQERALFGVLYPQLLGVEAGEPIEWYSVLLHFLRGAKA